VIKIRGLKYGQDAKEHMVIDSKRYRILREEGKPLSMKNPFVFRKIKG